MVDKAKSGSIETVSRTSARLRPVPTPPRFLSSQRSGRALGGGSRLRIAMLAPPWISVPPTGYGGIEAVVAQLCDHLVDRGHDITLFAAPDSHSKADVVTLLDEQHSDEIERALYECDHVARAFAEIDLAAARGKPFDLVHDHCGFTALAMADRLKLPLIHTLHGPFDKGTAKFYAAHGNKASLVAISKSQLGQAPAGLSVAEVIPNPIDVISWPLRTQKDQYLLWLGRMTEAKGPHRAIAVAKEAGVPLVLAGPVQPGQERFFAEEIEPHIDGHMIRYVGEVGGTTKSDLFAGARALLMPIRWCEPFGIVMIEAMACGTPVIAFPEGAASEVVVDGKTGYLVENEHEMAQAIGRLDRINPERCRNHVIENYDASRVAAAYEGAYRRVLGSPRDEIRAIVTSPIDPHAEQVEPAIPGIESISA